MYWSRSDSALGTVPVVPPVEGQSRDWVVGGVSYRSWRQAWRVLYGGTSCPSPRRYFGLSSRSRRIEAILNGSPPIWDLLAPAMSVSEPSVSVAIGIDLEKRGHEVRKLLYAGFGARIARHGYDPEEVLHDVYRGLLVRNKGKCPFDVRKSSFGHYVHMVIECILNNYHRKHSRHREKEIKVLDMGVDVGSESAILDRVSNRGYGVYSGGEGLAISMMSGRVRLAVSEGLISRRAGELALAVLPLLVSDETLGRSTPRIQVLASIGWVYTQSDWKIAISALRQVALDTDRGLDTETDTALHGDR